MTGLWMVFGPHLGCGKTAFLVWLAYGHHLTGKRIWANFSVKFADWIAPAELLMMKEHQDVTILIDELWTVLDSRQSISGENQFLNEIILASRKRGVTIMGTSQMPHMIDKRFRDIADYRVLCERRGKDHNINATIKAHVATWDIRASKALAVRPFRFKVKDVAELYNTKEVIERNRRLYITELAKILRDDDELMRDLYGCENITEQRELLYTYHGIKRSQQVAILKALGVR